MGWLLRSSRFVSFSRHLVRGSHNNTMQLVKQIVFLWCWGYTASGNLSFCHLFSQDQVIGRNEAMSRCQTLPGWWWNCRPCANGHHAEGDCQLIRFHGQPSTRPPENVVHPHLQEAADTIDSFRTWLNIPRKWQGHVEMQKHQKRRFDWQNGSVLRSSTFCGLFHMFQSFQGSSGHHDVVTLLEVRMRCWAEFWDLHCPRSRVFSVAFMAEVSIRDFLLGIEEGTTCWKHRGQQERGPLSYWGSTHFGLTTLQWHISSSIRSLKLQVCSGASHSKPPESLLGQLGAQMKSVSAPNHTELTLYRLKDGSNVVKPYHVRVE